MYDWIANILERCIVDLDGVPAYVVAGSACPEVLGDRAGVTGLLLDYRLRSYLQERGSWRGAGFATVITDDPELLACDVFDINPLAIAVHECGHYLASPAASVALTEEKLSAAPEALQAFITSGLWDQLPAHDRDVIAPPIEPWRRGDHDLRFIRACAHAHHRVETTADVCISPIAVFRGQDYALSSAFDYLHALRDECRERIAEPIRVILKTDPPAAATALWQQDTDRFYHLQGTPK